MDKIICVGKNYLEHAKELGDAVPDAPVLFLKPPSVLVPVHANEARVRAELPRDRGDVHYECEIVVRLARGGSNWSEADAATAFDAVTLGLDLTLRAEQSKLKKAGHPWEISKVFAGSAIVGPWIQRPDATTMLAEEFRFRLDGDVRQRGHARDMIFSLTQCLVQASRYFPLRAGDLLFTGTPQGVGPLKAGQRSELEWGSRKLFTVDWAEAAH